VHFTNVVYRSINMTKGTRAMGLTVGITGLGIMGGSIASNLIVSMWQKDMDIIANFARGLDCQTPLFDETAPIYANALAMAGGDQDTAAVFEVRKRSHTS
jgi:3-hydroxyisobutyrate dehydrogenase-like beta-hydroxyacid dehydrogenase